MSLSANESFLVWFSFLLWSWFEMRRCSLCQHYSVRVYNQNVSWARGDVHFHIHFHEGMGWAVPCSSVKTATAHIITKYIYIYIFLRLFWHSLYFQSTHSPANCASVCSDLIMAWLLLIRVSYLTSDSTTVPPRCHSKHAASSVTYGGNGVEANPTSHHHCPRNLPLASRKSLHLEKRVPGRDGEVGSTLKIINGSLFHNFSPYFHTELRRHGSLWLSPQSLNIGSAVAHT